MASVRRRTDNYLEVTLLFIALVRSLSSNSPQLLPSHVLQASYQATVLSNMGDSYFSFTNLHNVYQTVTDLTCASLLTLLVLQNANSLWRRYRWYKHRQTLKSRALGTDWWMHTSQPLLPDPTEASADSSES